MPSWIRASDTADGRRPGALRRLVRQRGAAVGLGVLGLLAVLAVMAPRLSPRDPIKTAPREALQPPGARFVLGSDQYGRDMLSRGLHGARISLSIRFLAGSIPIALGTPGGLGGRHHRR